MERNRPRIRPRILERLASLRELQSATGEELDALSSSPSEASGIPSVLRPSGGGLRESCDFFSCIIGMNGMNI